VFKWRDRKRALSQAIALSVFAHLARHERRIVRVRPAIDSAILASLAKAFTVLVAKVRIGVCDRNLLADTDILDGDEFHGSVALDGEAGIGVAVVVRKACRAQEKTPLSIALRLHNGKVTASSSQSEFLLLRNLKLSTNQVWDISVLSNVLSGSDGGLESADRVAVCSSGLPGAIRQPNGDVLVEVLNEVLFALWVRDAPQLGLEAWKFEELLDSKIYVFVEYHILLYDFGDFLLQEAARRRKSVRVLSDYTPEEDLVGN
jgi:hypothetical protein